MNVETGQIVKLTAGQEEILNKFKTQVVAVEESILTESQRAKGTVYLNDTTSPAAKLLHAARSRYMSHVGKKQLAKQEAAT